LASASSASASSSAAGAVGCICASGRAVCAKDVCAKDVCAKAITKAKVENNAKDMTNTAVSREAAPAPIDGLKADVLKTMTSPAPRRTPVYHAGVRLQQHGAFDSRDRQVL
jgi:hypothetical protein